MVCYLSHATFYILRWRGNQAQTVSKAWIHFSLTLLSCSFVISSILQLLLQVVLYFVHWFHTLHLFKRPNFLCMYFQHHIKKFQGSFHVKICNWNVRIKHIFAISSLAMRWPKLLQLHYSCQKLKKIMTKNGWYNSSSIVLHM